MGNFSPELTGTPRRGAPGSGEARFAGKPGGRGGLGCEADHPSIGTTVHCSPAFTVDFSRPRKEAPGTLEWCPMKPVFYFAIGL